jgi:hypothetical protein
MEQLLSGKNAETFTRLGLTSPQPLSKERGAKTFTSFEYILFTTTSLQPSLNNFTGS